jgi:hypothetical protein
VSNASSPPPGSGGPLVKEAPTPYYLFESNGRLLLIWRDVLFMVLLANFERSRWKWAGCNTELREAVPDDQVLFLGRWCSQSVSILDHKDKNYIDMGGNSIVYFSDDDLGSDYYYRKSVPFRCSVYDIKTRQTQTLLQTSVRPLKGFQPTWFFPPSQA